MKNRLTLFLGAAAALSLLFLFAHRDSFKAHTEAIFGEARNSKWLPISQHNSKSASDEKETVAKTENTLTLSEIHAIVKSTNGFFARDWPMWLGWNNVRVLA